MICDCLTFSKVERTPPIIESRVNEFLQKKKLRLMNPITCQKSGLLVLTFYCEKGSPSSKVKVFRHRSGKGLAEDINEFFKGHIMDYSTQVEVGAYIYTLFFYRKRRNGTKTEQNEA